MTRFPLFHAFSCSLLALASQSLGWQISGESVPAVPQEFRAAWISTVHNIDWPSRSGLSGASSINSPRRFASTSPSARSC